MKPKIKKNYFKIFFYGLALALSFLIIFAILVSFKIDYPYITWPTAWLTTIGLTWYLVQFLKIKNPANFFPVAIAWIFISFMLHYLITYKFAGLALFKNFEIWINYSLILLTGFLFLKLNSKK